MKKTIVACLFFLTSGCVATLSGQSAAGADATQFHTALDQLLQYNKPSPLQSFINDRPDSLFHDDAQRILALHSRANKCGSSLKGCEGQLDSYQQELKKLQEDIERLTRLNLDLDR